MVLFYYASGEKEGSESINACTTSLIEGNAFSIKVEISGTMIKGIMTTK